MGETQHYAISREIEIDYGHRIPYHRSKCKSLHGHRAKIIINLTGKLIEKVGTTDDGMIMDFGDIKKILIEEVHDVLDHGFIVHSQDPLKDRIAFSGLKLIELDVVPTAENLAKWCFDRINKQIKKYYRDDLKLMNVDFWETPKSKASYWEGKR